MHPWPPVASYATLAVLHGLSELPERGRRVQEFESAELRELLLGSYRLIYRIEDEAISIVTLVHGARDLAALWERRLRFPDKF